MAKNEDKYAPLGGQAVIEGVMMRSLKKIAVAVRNEGFKITDNTLNDLKKEGISDQLIQDISPLKNNKFLTGEEFEKELDKVNLSKEQKELILKSSYKNEIVTKIWDYIALKDKSKIWGAPFIRGVIALVESLYWGVKTLNYSASVVYEEETDQQASPFWTGMSFFIGILLAIGIFMGIPGFVFITLKSYIQEVVLLNLIEGGVRVIIFIVYLYAIKLIPDVQRVFQYHGAEHKVIHANEMNEELIYENIKKHNPAHSRCGTSFLLITLLISIVVFSLLGKSPTLLIRILSKLSLLPIVAAISYELIRQAGKYDLLKQKDLWIKKFFVTFAYILTFPGLWLQKITTAEPDEKQVEVAVVALKKAIE